MRFVPTFIFLLLAVTVGAQVVVSDSYNVAANGTGFALNSGVNAGINPPSTRLTGTAAANLRYIPTSNKNNTAFGIAGNKLRVTSAANPGRFVLSADGVTPYDFAPALGVSAATPQNPVVYDLSIRMANNSTGTQRFSFALATAEGDATTWDFGFQVFRTANSDTFYTIGKRIDVDASGLAADLNSFITNTAVGTYGTEISVLMRVTDAGNSRVQLSFDGGFTWFYDTATDPDLPNGWRLKGSGRYVIWDIAPDAGPVTYDDFALQLNPVSAILLSPANGAQNLGASPQLTAFVSNAAPGNITVTYYAREAPTPYPGPDFTIAALPDTQNYAREASSIGNAVKEMWYSQTEWIITNRVAWNIAYVAGLGDCVQNGDILNGDSNTTEWRIATNAMYRLESPSRTLLRAGIPYGEAVGNHDQEPNGDPDGTTTNYNNYFGVDHFLGMPYYGGHFSTNNDTWFQLFSASGLDFIVISFEYDRYGSAVMNWAMDVLATNQNRRVIVVTHNAGSDTTPVSFSTQGQTIYDTLKVNTNFFLMLAGHRFSNDGEGSRSDTYNGKTVWTLVSDYQGRTNGGDGLMRLMTFSPSNNVIRVKTFSPWTGQYETDADSQFTINYNMQLPTGPGSPGTPFAAVGTNNNVVPGTTNSATVSGLKPNTTYEWYVKVTDGNGNSITTPTSSFKTAVNSSPVASNLTYTVTGDQSAQVTLAGSDANGDSLTFQTNTVPAHGFLTTFNPTNGAVTYLPLHGFRGTDRFTYHANDSVANSPIATVTLNVVAPPDLNGNGLPDAWENQYGVTDPNADDDGDGQSNLAEYWANTNPKDPSSKLKILSANQTNGAFAFSWQSSGNTRYRVQYADAGTTNFIDVVRPVQAETGPGSDGAPSTQSFTDSGTGASGARLYRVKVIQ